MKVSLGGGTPTTLAAGQGSLQGIAIDAVNVYWSNNYDANAGQIMACAVGGCASSPTVLVGQQNWPQWVAANGSAVYWGTPWAYVNDGGPSGILGSVAPGGGNPSTLASSQGGVGGIALDAINVYWADSGSGTVMMLPLDGGTPTTLASGQATPFGVAVDGDNVYWTNCGNNPCEYGSGGSIMKCAIGGCGGAPTTLAAGQGSPPNIAVRAGVVYWPNYSGAAVMSVPASGGAPATLAAGLGSPWDIAVDGTSVYWTDVSDGTITRLVLK